MSVFNLDRIFQPKSIAVVGASEKPGSVGASVMQNLIAGGYAGGIYPVHPRYRKKLGFPNRMIPRENAYELTLDFRCNDTEAASEIQSYAAEIQNGRHY